MVKKLLTANHWIIASTANSSIVQVQVYDSLFTYPDKETERVFILIRKQKEHL